MRTKELPNEPSAFASSHRQRRTWLTVLVVLAALVVLATVAALTLPASAMSVSDMATSETAEPSVSGNTGTDEPQVSTALPEQAAAQAEAETAVLPEAAQVPEGYTEQRTVRDAESGVAVTVYAPEGVLPEDAVLCATLLDSSSEAYTQAGDALAADGMTTRSTDAGYGFAALDIHLEDAAGQEIEPQGDVYVSLDVTGLLPDTADPESVTVQHHAEQADGQVSVETVADTASETPGVVEVAAEAAADQTESAGTADVQAAFAVDSFSTFTITWETKWGNNDSQAYSDSLTVYRINEDGDGVGDTFTVESNGNVIDVFEVKNSHPLEGYTFEKVVVASDVQEALEKAKQETLVTDIRLNLNETGSGNNSSIDPVWQVYVRDSSSSTYGQWQDIPDGSSVYFIYSTGRIVTIDDSELITNGILQVHDPDALAGTTYTWYKDGVEVTRTAVSEVDGVNQYNVSEDGRQLNVALDEGSRATYTVCRTDDPTISSPTYTIPYYDSLQNGDFEANTYNAGSTYNPEYAEHFVASGTEDVVWKTTGYSEEHGSRIELVGKDTYVWHGVNYCPPTSAQESTQSSLQCAELNADSEGALYQDVLTMPGSVMNWSLMHNGRTRNGETTIRGTAYPIYVGYGEDEYGRRYDENNPASDTMYVLIMSTDQAENADDSIQDFAIDGAIDRQSEVQYVLEHLDEFPGASVTEITYEWYWTHDYNYYDHEYEYSLHVRSGQRSRSTDAYTYTNWETHTPGSNGEVTTVWANHTGRYTVPADQYLTRYFFVSGPTELGESATTGSEDAPNTVGNHIDNVHFGTDAPPAPSGSATLEIQKTVTGLSGADFDMLKESLTFTVTIDGDNRTIRADDSNFLWSGPVGNKTGTYLIQNIRIPADQTVTYSVKEDANTAELDDYKLTTTKDNVSGSLSNGQTAVATFTNAYQATHVSLTLSKTFADLSDNEVNYLIFRNKGFGFDVNYCVTEDYLAGDKSLTYMAPASHLEGFHLPGSSKDMSNGGDYGFTARDYLHIDGIEEVPTDGYKDESTGATLAKNSDGDWVFTITLDVPACDENHFFTVYEQHAEVPGYAKLNDSNVTYTIDDGLTTKSYTGKFVDYDGTDRNIYEDMPSEVQISDEDREKFDSSNVQEEVAIEDGYLTRLKIDSDTTIAFTNHYTGKLDVTKELDKDNAYDSAKTKDFKITLQPAHLDKLVLSNVNHHGLAGKTVQYRIDDATTTGNVETASLSTDGTITVFIKPGQTIHFLSLPAIQWQVVEADADVTGYTLATTYTDVNNNVKDVRTHWNGYNKDDDLTKYPIGYDSDSDGIASVDSDLNQTSGKNVALVTVTNCYTPNTVDITFKKVAADNQDTFLPGAEFRLYYEGSDTVRYYYSKSGDTVSWVDSADNATPFTSEANGTFTLPGLTIGTTYYLEETVAPDGYMLPEQIITISWQSSTPTPASGTRPLATSGEDADKVYLIPNSTGTQLPETGGTGTTFLTIGGLLMMAAAAGGYVLRRRRRKEVS